MRHARGHNLQRFRLEWPTVQLLLCVQTMNKWSSLFVEVQRLQATLVLNSHVIFLRAICYSVQNSVLAKFTSLLYLSKKNQYFLETKYFFYEVLFTCNEVRFLVNIYFLTSLLLLHFGKVKSTSQSRVSSERTGWNVLGSTKETFV